MQCSYTGHPRPQGLRLHVSILFDCVSALAPLAKTNLILTVSSAELPAACTLLVLFINVRLTQQQSVRRWSHQRQLCWTAIMWETSQSSPWCPSHAAASQMVAHVRHRRICRCSGPPACSTQHNGYSDRATCILKVAELPEATDTVTVMSRCRWLDRGRSGCKLTTVNCMSQALHRGHSSGPSAVPTPGWPHWFHTAGQHSRMLNHI
jgi:hypothetical protein